MAAHHYFQTALLFLSISLLNIQILEKSGEKFATKTTNLTNHCETILKGFMLMKSIPVSFVIEFFVQGGII